MQASVFGGYVQSAIADYAEDNVVAGRWARQGALERARAGFAALLPQGLATPDNHLFEIQAQVGGPTVGFLWVAIEAESGERSAHVYDIKISPEWRRQGHAKRAFEALEALLAELGVSSIGLHVFGHNPSAQALYARLGYGVTGINMQKRLVDGRSPSPASREAG